MSEGMRRRNIINCSALWEHKDIIIPMNFSEARVLDSEFLGSMEESR